MFFPPAYFCVLESTAMKAYHHKMPTSCLWTTMRRRFTTNKHNERLIEAACSGQPRVATLPGFVSKGLSQTRLPTTKGMDLDGLRDKKPCFAKQRNPFSLARKRAVGRADKYSSHRHFASICSSLASGSNVRSLRTTMHINRTQHAMGKMS